LFVRLTVSSSRPETARLKVNTASGSTPVQLPLLARADSRGRFEGFSRDDVIYLIMPDRFSGGDLRGVREHLGYLHDLGVTALWLTPVWKNTDSDYHGYHVVDFYALDDHMGSMQEYQALVADAHKLGMKVLIDYVVNHTGPHHTWANDPPTPTGFH